MTGQFSEIVAMTIANAVSMCGGNEEQVEAFFRKEEFDEDVRREIRRFAWNIVRMSGGPIRRGSGQKS